MAKIDDQRFAALLEEYKTLRLEIEKASQLRLVVLSFIVTAWAGMAAWLIANRTGFYAEPALLLLHIPLVVIYLLLQAAERHIMRVSTYIREFLEPEIDGLRWETRVAEFQRRSRFVLSTSQITTISLLVLSISGVGLSALFDIPPLVPHPKWVDFAMLAPLWAWLAFRQFPLALMLGSRRSEQPAAALWNLIKTQPRPGNGQPHLDQRRIFFGIPAFNKSDTVIDSVRSIIGAVTSRASDVNIVVFDDDSTDDTYSKVTQLQSQASVLRICQSDHRVGKSAGMNRLAELAKASGAELLCFFDADITGGPGSVNKLLAGVEMAEKGHIVAPVVLPTVEHLRFPLRQIFQFKADTEVLRMRYRAYVNGRAFGVRLCDFPKLPDNLRQCDDRYLTVAFGKANISPCFEAVFHYRPPDTLRALFLDRFKTQSRLIQLSKDHPNIYRQLRYKRFSFFHTYCGTYPGNVQREILNTTEMLTWVALGVHYLIVFSAKISAELLRSFREQQSE